MPFLAWILRLNMQKRRRGCKCLILKNACFETIYTPYAFFCSFFLHLCFFLHVFLKWYFMLFCFFFCLNFEVNGAKKRMGCIMFHTYTNYRTSNCTRNNKFSFWTSEYFLFFSYFWTSEYFVSYNISINWAFFQCAFSRPTINKMIPWGVLLT